MTEEDKFHTFLQKAITSPNIDPKYWYCFDRKLNRLFKLEAIDSNKEKLGSYTELPKIDYESKLNFIVEYAESQSPNVKEFMHALQ